MRGRAARARERAPLGVIDIFGKDPRALAVSPDGKLYVARFDFTEANNNGLISILSDSGECEEELVVQDCSELTGLFFSKV